MELALPLEKMSTAEKIKTMEAIWSDLCTKADSVVSPEWHQDVLNDREEEVKNGIEKFVDWNDAKRQIRKSVS